MTNVFEKLAKLASIIPDVNGRFSITVGTTKSGL